MFLIASDLKAYYEELKSLNELAFTFKEKERPRDYVVTIANAAHLYPLEYVLSGIRILFAIEIGFGFGEVISQFVAQTLLFEWDQKEVDDVLRMH